MGPHRGGRIRCAVHNLRRGHRLFSLCVELLDNAGRSCHLGHKGCPRSFSPVPPKKRGGPFLARQKERCLPLSAALRLLFPPVCPGLGQLQSDHHCNANKEKSNDHELHQIHKRRYRNSKRRRVHFNPEFRPRHHSRTHRQQQSHGIDAPCPWPLPSRQTGRMRWHLEEAEQGHRF